MNRVGQIMIAMQFVLATQWAPAQSVSRTVELTYRAQVTSIPEATERIALWLPLPASHEFQKVSNVRLSASHRYEVLIEEKFKNRYLFVEVQSEDDIQLLPLKKTWVEMTATVTRHAYNRLDTQFTMHNPRGDLARFLSPSKMVPIDGPIAAEATAIVGNESKPLKRAHLLYNNIVNTVTYDKSGDGWGRGDALFACDVRAGNCSDFHSLFIGEARSLDIPARFIMGFPLPESTTEGTIEGYHCWAEFFVPSKGWVPIDASEAQKHPEKRERFFGGLDENRIEFTVGRDIKLPKSVTEEVNYSIYPHLEINGKASSNIEATITFKDME